MFSDDSAWRVDPGAGDLKEQRLVCLHLPTKHFSLQLINRHVCLKAILSKSHVVSAF